MPIKVEISNMNMPQIITIKEKGIDNIGFIIHPLQLENWYAKPPIIPVQLTATLRNSSSCNIL